MSGCFTQADLQSGGDASESVANILQCFEIESSVSLTDTLLSFEFPLAMKVFLQETSKIYHNLTVM